MIGQTKNKANLKGKDVEIKVKDEIGRLGDAVNVVPNMEKAKFFAMDEGELNICDDIEKKW